MLSLFSAVLVAASLGAPDPQQPATPAPDITQLRVATPTYRADGTLGGGTSAGVRPQAGQTSVILYAYSGKTLCQSSAPEIAAEWTPGYQPPSDAGFGWRVEITPALNVSFDKKMGVKPGRTDALVVRVRWSRQWDRGEKLTGAAPRETFLELHPGDHVLLDYLNAPQQQTAAPCNAIGMGLELSLDRPKESRVVETDLWLVHQLPDGTEQTQHQVLRTRMSGSTDYFFDDLKNVPTRNGSVAISGNVAPYGGTDGKLHIKLDIAARYVVNPNAPLTIGGSSGYDTAIAPGEVLSFNLPVLNASDGALTGHKFSLRIRTTQIR